MCIQKLYWQFHLIISPPITHSLTYCNRILTFWGRNYVFFLDVLSSLFLWWYNLWFWILLRRRHPDSKATFRSLPSKGKCGQALRERVSGIRDLGDTSLQGGRALPLLPSGRLGVDMTWHPGPLCVWKSIENLCPFQMAFEFWVAMESHEFSLYFGS